MIPIGRIIPVVRAYVSYPASVQDAAVAQFGELTTGRRHHAERRLTLIEHTSRRPTGSTGKSIRYVDYVVIAAMASLGWLAVRRARGGGPADAT